MRREESLTVAIWLGGIALAWVAGLLFLCFHKP
jgi:hypothetical protein